MDDLKSKDPYIDTAAIKVDVPTVNPPNPPHQAQHPPAPGRLGFPAFHPQGYAPVPGNPGHHPPNPAPIYQHQPAPPVMAPQAFGLGRNPIAVRPPPVNPWQFPQYVANPAPPVGNPQVNFQRQPIPAPPAPVRQARGMIGNRQGQILPKRPVGRARRR